MFDYSAQRAAEFDDIYRGGGPASVPDPAVNQRSCNLTHSLSRRTFLAGAAAPTVTVPATVAWSPATPVFEAGKWYELSFVALGTGYVGVWTAAEVS